MKLDRFLELLFGKVGIIAVALLLLTALLFSTACASEDFEGICTEGDCLSLLLCGCLTPETTCNILSCMGEQACDTVCSIPEACGDACDAWYDCDKGCISDCGDGYVNCLLCTTGSLVDCAGSCDTTEHDYECMDCGTGFDADDTRNGKCPKCNSGRIRVLAEMYVCKTCGKQFSKSARGYNSNSGKYYCPYCVSYMIEKAY